MADENLRIICEALADAARDLAAGEPTAKQFDEVARRSEDVHALRGEILAGRELQTLVERVVASIREQAEAAPQLAALLPRICALWKLAYLAPKQTSVLESLKVDVVRVEADMPSVIGRWIEVVTDIQARVAEPLVPATGTLLGELQTQREQARQQLIDTLTPINHDFNEESDYETMWLEVADRVESVPIEEDESSCSTSSASHVAGDRAPSQISQVESPDPVIEAHTATSEGDSEPLSPASSESVDGGIGDAGGVALDSSEGPRTPRVKPEVTRTSHSPTVLTSQADLPRSDANAVAGLSDNDVDVSGPKRPASTEEDARPSARDHLGPSEGATGLAELEGTQPLEPHDVELATDETLPECSPAATCAHPGTQLPEQVLFDKLLGDGEFAYAYWVAYASLEFDANIVGVLCEGARIEPRTACSSRLATYLDDLAVKPSWTDDEYLLAQAALLQPILFLCPHPEALYQLASVTTTPKTPLSGLIAHFRDTCLSQGITLGPTAVLADDEGDRRRERIEELVEEAGKFLQWAPSIRFGYRPAERALKFLFRPGTPWNRLDRLVSGDSRKRLAEVKKICQEIDPREMVARAHIEMEGLKRLEGPAREKLVKHISDSKVRAEEWMALVRASSEPNEGEDEVRASQLKLDVLARLNDASEALDNWGTTAVVTGIKLRIEDLVRILDAKERSPLIGVEDACVDLPDLPLDDDMKPQEIDQLVRVVRHRATGGPTDPVTIFEQCLARDEFVRADLLVDRHELGDDAHEQLRKRRKIRQDELKHRLDDIQPRVEEAFLLGQLWNDAQATNEQRTDLLSLVSRALADLDVDDKSLNFTIRSVTQDVDDIEDRLNAISKDGLRHLIEEKSKVIAKFPRTQEGEADGAYFEDEFGRCLEQEDHVAAFDLIDRAAQAISQGDPIVRAASTKLSESLGRFLRFDRDNRDAVRQGISRYLEGIRQGQVILGIDFGHLPTDVLTEAVSMLETWASVRPAAPDYAACVESVCRFLGFSIESDATKVRGIDDRAVHVRVALRTEIRDCPVPRFGSSLAGRLDFVVCSDQREPEDLIRLLSARPQVRGRGVLVLLLRPISARYRLRWQSACVDERVSAIPLDPSLLFHLCGERNRLRALLDAGLPFTWDQPYITKGETVAPEMFVGRSTQAEDLVSITGSCIVYGGRQLGKSALLNHVRSKYHSPDEDLFIGYLDIDGLGDSQEPEQMVVDFWQRVATHLIQIDALPQDLLRKTKTRWDQAVPDAISNVLSSNEGRRILLLLDEADDLLDCDSGSGFGLVRRLRGLMADSSRRFKVVLAGLQSVQRYRNWPNHPFAQLGGEVVIDPLRPKHAEDLILRPFRALGFEFDDARLVRRVLSLANYHPGLIQIFCYRLLEILYSRQTAVRGSTPVRRITAAMLSTVENDESFQEDVRNRFDWTLDLDERYKVITYGLVLSGRPTMKQTIQDFLDLGRSWWPRVFDSMDAQAMRAVLDEMVGLGVLVAETSGDTAVPVRQYRLRSPNLLRLLGPEEAIEQELERIMSLEERSRPNPRYFHGQLDGRGHFGPLTREQESLIADTTHPFSLVLVIGSHAMGLRTVRQQVQKTMRDVSTSDTHSRIDAGGGWEEIVVKPIADDVIRPDRLLKDLTDKLRRRRRAHGYVVVDFSDVEVEGELGDFLWGLVNKLSSVCRTKSRGKVVVTLGPDGAWDWRSDNPNVALSTPIYRARAAR